ncbi:MAG: 50S ribosomal protein L21, partial [Rickettsiales bacterium]|nr:50S ribosomal protein L21 [Rickettsiales bacterium]
QYRAKVGDTIKVEKLTRPASRAEVSSGEKIEFDNVLMIGDKVGTPTISGAKVIAEILEQKRLDKILIFKKKRRQNYRRTGGHRQHISVIKITEIKG